LILIEYVGKVVALASTGMNPESTTVPEEAFTNGVQGSGNVDRVTVWFLAWNSNVMVSPTLAVKLAGLNARVPLTPTITLWSAAKAEAAEETKATMSDNRILSVMGGTRVRCEKDWVSQRQY